MSKRDQKSSYLSHKKGATILVIEDNPSNLKVVVAYLEETDFDCMVARTGERGLEMAALEPPDLILLDVLMPGIDGFEVCRRLKADETTRNIPVLFMTALTSLEDKVKGLEVGGVDYLTKPIQQEELLARINTHLELRALTHHLEDLVAERTADLKRTNEELHKEVLTRKKAEKEIRNSHDRFAAVMDSLEALVYVADMESYELLFINRYGRDIFGDIEGRLCWQSLQVDQSGPCDFCSNDMLLDDKGEPRDEYAWEFQNTVNARWYDIHDRAIKWIDGRTVRIEIASDITDRKEVEKKLTQYASELEESNRIKDLFTDIMRHDLMNPAGVIRNCSELLYEGENDSGKKEMIELIRDNSQQFIEMIENASIYSRLQYLEELDRDMLCLGAILKDNILNFTFDLKEKEMHLQFDPQGEYPLKANKMIRDVFSNLISNAIKYGDEGSAVEIDIDDEEGTWLISVKNSGEKIADEEKEKIFERFERAGMTNIKGTGLGLAIAKRIVELHKGRIWVDDNPEGGSIFCVRLPKEG